LHTANPLLDLAAAVALLIWAARLTRTGLERVLGERLRGVMAAATQGRLRASAVGLVTASLLQSSTAAALLVVSFVQRGIIAVPLALAVLLGADLGSSLVVQALISDIGGIAPALILLGAVLSMAAPQPHLRNLGRTVIGLGLMLMALGLISGASATFRDDPVLRLVLLRLADQPVLGLLLAAVLTWLAHSSVAAILFFISLAATGLIGPQQALVLVLGANVGAGLVALGLSFGAGTAARQVLAGNLLFRLIGAFAALPLVPFAAGWIAALGWGDARALATAHTAFNLALVILFLPLVGVTARLLEQFGASGRGAPLDAALPLLDPAALAQPKVALTAASRQALRLAETVEVMLREAIRPFEDSDAKRREEIRQLDSTVDTACEAIVRYLTRLTKQPLQPDEARAAFDLILFTTNFEHVGDIIDKNLLSLAQKKQRLNLAFSDEGWDELQRMHALAVAQTQLAVTVFLTRDRDMARQLVRTKDQVRAMERAATESHLRRLRDGTVASIETSSLHMDMLRDFKRIIAHLTAVAYPILEEAGELQVSRLTAPVGLPQDAAH